MPMKATKIRFEQEEYDVLKSVADEYHVSLAEVVRLAVAGNLAKYLGTIRYVDQKQASDICKVVLGCKQVLWDIRDQIRRIGVNYNQEIKLRNIEAQIKAKEQEIPFGRTGNYTHQLELKELRAQISAIEKDRGSLNRKDLDALVARVDAVGKVVGDAMCRIVQ